MDVRQRIDALETALDNETKERDFYLAHAARTRNPLGREMFLQIADDELEHYERLKQIREKWKSHEQWPETVELTVKQTAIQAALSDMIRKARGSAAAETGDLEALKVAADFEARGAEAYTRLSEAVADAREKAFFALLASIEREHCLSLKDAEEFLKDPSSWFTRRERHGLDGA